MRVSGLQLRELDGHKLQLSFSQAAKGQEEKEQAKGRSRTSRAPTSKLLVRNVPFEATKKELRELFGTFGQVKSLRLPQKFDRSHRGFCFVDFLTKNEAQNAYKSLAATHFYGRHLVIEYAKEDESLAELRAKTDAKFKSAEAAAVGVVEGGGRQKGRKLGADALAESAARKKHRG